MKKLTKHFSMALQSSLSDCVQVSSPRADLLPFHQGFHGPSGSKDGAHHYFRRMLVRCGHHFRSRTKQLVL